MENARYKYFLFDFRFVPGDLRTHFVQLKHKNREKQTTKWIPTKFSSSRNKKKGTHWEKDGEKIKVY